MNTSKKMDSKHDEIRSFNILGRSFQIRISHLARYPNTLLADSTRLRPYWRSNLNAYFLSRDVQMFERIILPFYMSPESPKKIQRLLMPSLSESLFRDELTAYNLLEYYHPENIANFLFAHRSSIISRLLIRDSVCRCVIDCVSGISCALGVYEVVYRRCHPRAMGLMIGDIVISLVLLSASFCEQYFVRKELKTLPNEHFILLVPSQSPVFFVQLIFALFPYIVTLLSYKYTGTWYFIMGLACRHFLLLRLCLSDLCHLIDILFHAGRSSFRVLSHLLLFLATVMLMCIWIGLTLYVTDSSSINHSTVPAPSRYIYFAYQLVLNVGYGDTTEQSIFSSLVIIVLILITCPLLIIIYQNLVHEIKALTTSMAHVETLHHSVFVDQLMIQLVRRRQSKMIIDKQTA